MLEWEVRSYAKIGPLIDEDRYIRHPPGALLPLMIAVPVVTPTFGLNQIPPATIISFQLLLSLISLFFSLSCLPSSE